MNFDKKYRCYIRDQDRTRHLIMETNYENASSWKELIKPILEKFRQRFKNLNDNDDYNEIEEHKKYCLIFDELECFLPDDSKDLYYGSPKYAEVCEIK